MADYTCLAHTYPSSSIPSAVCGSPVRQAFPTTTEYVTCTRYGHVTQTAPSHRA
jgi:hypothetical protein